MEGSGISDVESFGSATSELLNDKNGLKEKCVEERDIGAGPRYGLTVGFGTRGVELLGSTIRELVKNDLRGTAGITGSGPCPMAACGISCVPPS